MQSRITPSTPLTPEGLDRRLRGGCGRPSARSGPPGTSLSSNLNLKPNAYRISKHNSCKYPPKTFHQAVQILLEQVLARTV